METHTLQTLESLCETLYNTQDAAQRAQTEQVCGYQLSCRCSAWGESRAAAIIDWLRCVRPRGRCLPRSACSQMLRPFGTSTEYISQCRAVLDASSNPFAQHFAAASLLKVLTEQSTLSPQVCAPGAAAPVRTHAYTACTVASCFCVSRACACATVGAACVTDHARARPLAAAGHAHLRSQPACHTRREHGHLRRHRCVSPPVT